MKDERFRQLETHELLSNVAPEEALLSIGADETMTSGVSCSIYQNGTAMKVPSAVKQAGWR